jgi:hypothetical protein
VTADYFSVKVQGLGVLYYLFHRATQSISCNVIAEPALASRRGLRLQLSVCVVDAGPQGVGLPIKATMDIACCRNHAAKNTSTILPRRREARTGFCRPKVSFG